MGAVLVASGPSVVCITLCNIDIDYTMIIYVKQTNATNIIISCNATVHTITGHPVAGQWEAGEAEREAGGEAD